VAIEFMCRKVGMTQYFNEAGECIPVTVLDAQPNRIVQKKTPETDGYAALQLGYGERKASRTTKAMQGHFEKAKVASQRLLKESRVTPEELEGYEVGQEIEVGIFEQGQRVDVIGTSKGRGTAGVVKRHNFSIKRKTHGTHEAFRHAGSIGAGSYPGRVLKGVRMAGRMGNERVTTLNVEVVRVDPEKRLLFVRGGVPGHNDGVVRVRASRRGRK
jgi:large subunit ribosomal protein L3